MFKFKKVTDPFKDPAKREMISWKSVELLKKYTNRF